MKYIKGLDTIDEQGLVPYINDFKVNILRFLVKKLIINLNILYWI